MTRRVTDTALPALIVVFGFLAAAILAVLVVSEGDLVENDRQATTYLVGGRADIPRGQTQDDVIVARGVVTVDGTVEDDVIVGSGRVRLNGIVHGDVIVLRGSARLGPDAEIDGDLRTSRPPRVAAGALVRGDVAEVTLFSALGELPRSLWFAGWLAAGLTVLVAGFLLPRRVADAAHHGAGRPARAFLLGGLALVVAPVVVGVLALSLLGMGLAMVAFAVVLLGATVGAAAAGTAVGRLIGLPEGPVSFLAGWGAIGFVLALALLANPVLAALAGAAVAAFGLGSLVPGRERPAADDGDDDDRPDPEGREPEVADDEPKILASFPIGSAAGPT